MSQHSTRIISFDISEGLETVIGKADKNDESRSAKVDNLLYEDDELSERHAKIVIKRLDEGKRDIYSAVEFLRIYLEDLSGCGSGIVDLETANAETSLRFIDLKNGDRFGLIRKDDPLFDGQSRGAKIKLRLALRHGNQTNPNRWGLVVSDVSDQRSPCASRSNNLQDYTPKDLTPSPFLPQDLSQDLNWETESGSDLSFMRPISSSDSETTSGSDFSAENDTKEAEKIKLKPIEALKPFSIINMLTDDVESTTFFPDNTPHETVAAEKNDQDGQCGESNHKKPLKLRLCGTPYYTIQHSKKQFHLEQKQSGASAWKRSFSEREEYNDAAIVLDTEAPSKKARKIDYYSGSLGIVIGSLGTIGLLTAIANCVER